jgi:hypothetical protein
MCEPALPVRRSSGNPGRRRERAADKLFSRSGSTLVSAEARLPPLQGGSLFLSIPGVKTPG